MNWLWPQRIYEDLQSSFFVFAVVSTFFLGSPLTFIHCRLKLHQMLRCCFYFHTLSLQDCCTNVYKSEEKFLISFKASFKKNKHLYPLHTNTHTWRHSKPFTHTQTHTRITMKTYSTTLPNAIVARPEPLVNPLGNPRTCAMWKLSHFRMQQRQHSQHGCHENHSFYFRFFSLRICCFFLSIYLLKQQAMFLGFWSSFPSRWTHKKCIMPVLEME